MQSTRIWLPLVLGVAAAAGNFVVLRNATSTHELLAFRTDLKPGEVVTAEVLRVVRVRGEDSLWQGTVPASEQAALLGKPVRRHIKAGEMLFQVDLDLEEYQIRKEYLPEGYQTLSLPARRLAVASRPMPGDSVRIAIRTTANDLGVAYYGPYLFLGWYQEPSRSGTLESEAPIRFAIALPIHSTGDDRRLQDLQASLLPDRVIAVEVVRPSSTSTAVAGR